MEYIFELLKGWGGWVAAAIVSIFAIRGSIKFDVNQWLKDRREVQREKARMLCPHADFSKKDDQGKLIVRSLFTSPFGTLNYVCEQCRTVVHSEELVDETLQYWADNPEKLKQHLEEFDKATKKLY